MEFEAHMVTNITVLDFWNEMPCSATHKQQHTEQCVIATNVKISWD
jgi:hypothetical protein